MKTILLLVSTLVLAACGLPPEYVVKEDLFPNAVGSSVTSEKGYRVFRISDNETVLGYMLRIDLEEGQLFLKVLPDGILDKAILYKVDEANGDKKYAIFQGDWGQPLARFAERPLMRAACTHFLTNRLAVDLNPKKGSALSIF